MSEGLVQIKKAAVRRPEGADRVPEPAPAPGAPRLFIETYGCQMNVADSDLIAGLFGQGGYARAETPADADVILLNTCAVREKAEERVFARAAELKVHKRRRPGVVLGITGCMAEHLKEQVVERAPWIDVVAGPDSYRRLGELVKDARDRETGLPWRAREGRADESKAVVDVHLDKLETYEGLDSALGGDGVSGFVTIQRGCDKFCTFCVVPFTRGRERGTPPREILRQARALADAGYKEITLLGQTVNSYRHEEARFADLLRAVARIDGLERIRFTSPYPIDFSAEVIAAIAEEPKVCKYVHLPLQSGSDVMLERMRRGYTLTDFRTIVRDLRAAVPDIAISTDILVGFSGETEEDHARTVEVMRELRFDSSFTFAYSEREGTYAARRMPDDVPDEVKKRRLIEVIHLQEVLSAEVNTAYVGRTERILLHAESRRNPEQLIGRTDTFKAVIVPRGDRQPKDLVDVRIERSTSATLFGILVS